MITSKPDVARTRATQHSKAENPYFSMKKIVGSKSGKLIFYEGEYEKCSDFSTFFKCFHTNSY